MFMFVVDYWCNSADFKAYLRYTIVTHAVNITNIAISEWYILVFNHKHRTGSGNCETKVTQLANQEIWNQPIDSSSWISPPNTPHRCSEMSGWAAEEAGKPQALMICWEQDRNLPNRRLWALGAGYRSNKNHWTWRWADRGYLLLARPGGNRIL